jgi:hypothetical protein
MSDLKEELKGRGFADSQEDNIAKVEGVTKHIWRKLDTHLLPLVSLLYLLSLL